MELARPARVCSNKVVSLISGALRQTSPIPSLHLPAAEEAETPRSPIGLSSPDGPGSRITANIGPNKGRHVKQAVLLRRNKIYLGSFASLYDLNRIRGPQWPTNHVRERHNLKQRSTQPNIPGKIWKRILIEFAMFGKRWPRAASDLQFMSIGDRRTSCAASCTVCISMKAWTSKNW